MRVQLGCADVHACPSVHVHGCASACVCAVCLCARGVPMCDWNPLCACAWSCMSVGWCVWCAWCAHSRACMQASVVFASSCICAHGCMCIYVAACLPVATHVHAWLHLCDLVRVHVVHSRVHCVHAQEATHTAFAHVPPTRVHMWSPYTHACVSVL